MDEQLTIWALCHAAALASARGVWHRASGRVGLALCVLLAASVPAVVVARPLPHDHDALYPPWVDGTAILTQLFPDLRPAVGVPTAPRRAAAPQAVVGDRRSFFSFDFKRLRQTITPATLRGVGEFCYVYVADDQWNARVAEETVEAVRRAFDDETAADPRRGIYEIDVEAFGDPPDIDGDRRVLLLLMDIPDNFVPPNGSFIAGYFASVNQHAGALTDPRYGIAFDSNETEMLYVDSDPLNPGTTFGLGIIAHELQHLIHYAFDDNEEVWLNEGLSDLAMLICGYPPGVHVRSFQTQPNVSLTQWPGGVGSSLPFYGAAYLWMVYLDEHYGGSETIRRVAQSPEKGLLSVASVIQAAGFTRSIEDAYSDYRVAVVADDGSFEDGRYGFRDEQVDVDGRAHLNLPVPRQRRSLVAWAGDALDFTPVGGEVAPLQVDVTASGRWRDAFGVRALLFSGGQLVNVRAVPRALLDAVFTDAFQEFGQDVDRIALSVVFLPDVSETATAEFVYSARLAEPIDFDVRAFRNPVLGDYLEIVVLSEPPIETGTLLVQLASQDRNLEATMKSLDEGNTFGASLRTRLPESGSEEWAWELVHFDQIVGLGTVQVP